MTYQFEIGAVLQQWDRLAEGAVFTLVITAVSITVGTLIGTLGAVASVYGGSQVKRVTAMYVEAIRNTPFLIQLFIVFFGLPTIGVQVDAITASLFAMSVNLGAYATEIIRAGMQAVHPSQLEAAEALGMSKWQMIRHVVLVPAFEKVYPALTSQFTLMMLTSSVLSTISVEELTAVASRIDSETFKTFETYFTVMFMYVGLALLMRFGFHGLAQIVFRRRRVIGKAKRLSERGQK